jgi:hypothetical protein
MRFLTSTVVACGELNKLIPTRVLTHSLSPQHTMFTITRLPAATEFAPEEVRGASDDDVEMVAAYDDLGEGTSSGRRSVVTPGEVITSAKEYMRWVSRAG